MELSERVLKAQTDAAEMDHLVADYLPFIKKEASKYNGYGLEYDDKLSLGMLVFVNCVRQYQPARGNFVSFVSVCVRNRLLDVAAKQNSMAALVQSPMGSEEDVENAAYADEASLWAYSLTLEQQTLAEEIDALSQSLKQFDITFDVLSKNSPRQKRSRGLCMQLAQAVVRNEMMRHSLFANRRLPQAKLAEQFEISEKTVEKYRRYIVALAVILEGDYPAVKTFLPHAEMREEK